MISVVIQECVCGKSVESSTGDCMLAGWQTWHPGQRMSCVILGRASARLFGESVRIAQCSSYYVTCTPSAGSLCEAGDERQMTEAPHVCARTGMGRGCMILLPVLKSFCFLRIDEPQKPCTPCKRTPYKQASINIVRVLRCIWSGNEKGLPCVNTEQTKKELHLRV